MFFYGSLAKTRRTVNLPRGYITRYHKTEVSRDSYHSFLKQAEEDICEGKASSHIFRFFAKFAWKHPGEIDEKGWAILLRASAHYASVVVWVRLFSKLENTCSLPLRTPCDYNFFLQCLGQVPNTRFMRKTFWAKVTAQFLAGWLQFLGGRGKLGESRYWENHISLLGDLIQHARSSGDFTARKRYLAHVRELRTLLLGYSTHPDYLFLMNCFLTCFGNTLNYKRDALLVWNHLKSRDILNCAAYGSYMLIWQKRNNHEEVISLYQNMIETIQHLDNGLPFSVAAASYVKLEDMQSTEAVLSLLVKLLGNQKNSQIYTSLSLHAMEICLLVSAFDLWDKLCADIRSRGEEVPKKAYHSLLQAIDDDYDKMERYIYLWREGGLPFDAILYSYLLRYHNARNSDFNTVQQLVYEIGPLCDNNWVIATLMQSPHFSWLEIPDESEQRE